jgi:hypothetical protein
MGDTTPKRPPMRKKAQPPAARPPDPAEAVEGGEPVAGEAVEPGDTPRATAGSRRRFKPRQLETADGGRLRIRHDGVIVHVDAAGQVVGSWATGDPEWERRAIRFGLRPQRTTVAPHGGRDSGSKPPGW